MKRKPSSTGDETDTGRPAPLSAMLLFLQDTPCILTEEEENALARRIADQSDEDASTRLYNGCLKRLFYHFYRKTRGNVPDTENLTNETFTRAWQGLCDGSWTGEAFGRWLFGIARNVFLEWLRDKPKQFVNIDQSEYSLSGEMVQSEQTDMLDDLLIRVILWKLVEQLPVRDREILLLRFHYHLHYAEMAPLLQCSEKACRTRCWRAVNHLRAKALEAGFDTTFWFGKSTTWLG